MKAKIKALKPSEVAFWRYDSQDGSVAIYLPDGDKMTVERANFLLDRAKLRLMDIVDRKDK